MGEQKVNKKKTIYTLVTMTTTTSFKVRDMSTKNRFPT